MSFILDRLKAYAIARLQERTTWVGIAGWLATAVGATLSPEYRDVIVQVGLSISTLLVAAPTARVPADGAPVRPDGMCDAAPRAPDPAIASRGQPDPVPPRTGPDLAPSVTPIRRIGPDHGSNS